MKKMTKRDKQTIRFLKWIKHYPGWWYLICTPNDEHMNIEMMNTLIKHLSQEKLYEIIFVLLMVHRKERFMKNISTYVLLDLVVKNWSGKRKNRKGIIEEFLKYLE